MYISYHDPLQQIAGVPFWSNPAFLCSPGSRGFSFSPVARGGFSPGTGGSLVQDLHVLPVQNSPHRKGDPRGQEDQA